MNRPAVDLIVLRSAGGLYEGSVKWAPIPESTWPWCAYVGDFVGRFETMAEALAECGRKIGG